MPTSGQLNLPNGRFPKQHLPTFLGPWGAEMREWAVRSGGGAAHIGIGTDPHSQLSIGGLYLFLLTKLTKLTIPTRTPPLLLHLVVHLRSMSHML
jgi:hypothetical protein